MDATIRMESIWSLLQPLSLSNRKWLIDKLQDSVRVEEADLPSPSGDKWFDDSANMQSVQQGIADMKQGRTKQYSMDDIKTVLGV